MASGQIQTLGSQAFGDSDHQLKGLVARLELTDGNHPLASHHRGCGRSRGGCAKKLKNGRSTGARADRMGSSNKEAAEVEEILGQREGARQDVKVPDKNTQRRVT